MMNAVVKNLMLNAAKVIGKDVDGILSFIEEQLTLAEYKKVEAFLSWSFKTGKTFGWGNIDERISEFEAS